jgi:hypothetical protein
VFSFDLSLPYDSADSMLMCSLVATALARFLLSLSLLLLGSSDLVLSGPFRLLVVMTS